MPSALAPRGAAESSERAPQKLVMGDALPAITLPGQRNRDEGRTVTIQAVCDRA
jgi:hypothetical protein